MSVRRLFKEADRDIVVLLTAAGALLALQMNYGSARFGAWALGGEARDPAAVGWLFLAVFLLFGVVPALVWRLWIRRPLLLMGLSGGDRRYALRMLVWLLPFVVAPLMFLASLLPDLRAEYPLARGLPSGAGAVLLYEVAYLLYYLGWEAFYRGFLLFGLERRIGSFPAAALTTLISTAVHMGKPEGEVWGALIAGFLFAWLALRTRSFIWSFVVHAAVGVLIDLFVLFGPGGLR